MAMRETKVIKERALKEKVHKCYYVPLGKMKTPPANIVQRPMVLSRVAKILKDLDLDRLGQLTVNHRDGEYWILDGQNRVEALRQFGFKPEDKFDCRVYENLTEEESANVFLGVNDYTPVNSYSKFCVSVTAGRVRETAIRRVVEANGCKVSRGRGENCIGAVSTLCQIYDRSTTKDVAVGWVVRVAKKSFDGDPLSFDTLMLAALGAIHNRFGNAKNGSKPIDEDVLVDRLHGIRLRVLLQRAEQLRQRTGAGRSDCLASVITDVYNGGMRGSARLQPWWKVRDDGAA